MKFVTDVDARCAVLLLGLTLFLVNHDRIPRFTRNKVRPRRITAHLAARSVMLSSIPQHLVNAVFDEATKKDDGNERAYQTPRPHH